MVVRGLQLVVVASLLGGCLGATPSRPSGTAQAERLSEIESRIQRLENRAENAQLLELLQRVDALQADIRALRGDSERTTHELESLNRRQRELYLDLDRRLQNLETGGRSAPPSSTAPLEPRDRVDTMPRAPGQDEQRVRYESAFRLLQEGRYPAAINAFQAYLDEFPGGNYADNAQYWLAEVFYVTRSFEQAAIEFRKVLDAFPGSQKVPDAMLKIGYVHYELQQWDSAREMLTRVSELVPDSNISRLAQQRLQRMRQEGR